MPKSKRDVRVRTYMVQTGMVHGTWYRPGWYMVQIGMGTDEGLPTSENRDPKHTSVVCTYGRIRCSGVGTIRYI